MAIERIHLGAPVWSCRAWAGELWPTATKPADYLHHYARVFNAVEGNATFYAVPRRETAARWRDETPPGFRFCCKLPRTITHERSLVGPSASSRSSSRCSASWASARARR